MSSQSVTAGAPTDPGLGAGGDLITGRRRPGEAVIKALLASSAFLSVAVTVGIVIALLTRC